MARVFGLTGGIASGKSTVAALFRELGAVVVDADEIAREVVAPGTAGLEAIVDRFGPAVLDPRGHLDRKKLASLVFDDARARADLNAITHPRIAAASQARISLHIATGADPVIYEAALLVENNLHRRLDGLIVVSVPHEVQVQRLMGRDGLGDKAAGARIAAQLPLADKVAAADFVIDNAGTVEETRQQVSEIWRQINR